MEDTQDDMDVSLYVQRVTSGKPSKAAEKGIKTISHRKGVVTTTATAMRAKQQGGMVAAQKEQGEGNIKKIREQELKEKEQKEKELKEKREQEERQEMERRRARELMKQEQELKEKKEREKKAQESAARKVLAPPQKQQQSFKEIRKIVTSFPELEQPRKLFEIFTEEYLASTVADNEVSEWVLGELKDLCKTFVDEVIPKEVAVSRKTARDIEEHRAEKRRRSISRFDDLTIVGTEKPGNSKVGKKKNTPNPKEMQLLIMENNLQKLLTQYKKELGEWETIEATNIATMEEITLKMKQKSATGKNGNGKAQPRRRTLSLNSTEDEASRLAFQLQHNAEKLIPDELLAQTQALRDALRKVNGDMKTVKKQSVELTKSFEDATLIKRYGDIYQPASLIRNFM